MSSRGTTTLTAHRPDRPGKQPRNLNVAYAPPPKGASDPNRADDPAYIVRLVGQVGAGKRRHRANRKIAPELSVADQTTLDPARLLKPPLGIQHGKTTDEIAADALRRYLAHRKLEELGKYAREQSHRLGYTEADVPRLIAESRRENRGP